MGFGGGGCLPIQDIYLPGIRPSLHLNAPQAPPWLSILTEQLNPEDTQ